MSWTCTSAICAKKMDTGFDTKLIRTVWGSGWTLRED